jgi:mRNA-degrading endonuclease RelE of RelBE toxin-antitoxin system
MTIMMVIMASSKRFEIIYPSIIKQHLKAIEPKFYSLIRKSLETSMQYQPDVEKTNRKPLKRTVVFGAKWELRFGVRNCFRVYYRIDYDHKQVILLAIGQKEGNHLFIGGEEMES